MEILCTKRLDNLGIVMGTLKEFGIDVHAYGCELLYSKIASHVVTN